jgi:hypothetical protein
MIKEVRQSPDWLPPPLPTNCSVRPTRQTGGAVHVHADRAARLQKGGPDRGEVTTSRAHLEAKVVVIKIPIVHNLTVQLLRMLQ